MQNRICLLVLLFCYSAFSLSFEEIIITPNSLNGWMPINVRDDAIVEINENQPLFGDGSLMFATDTITPTQDKADFQFIWQTSPDSIEFPDRNLANISALNVAWFRDSTSTTAAHLLPVVRLQFFDDAGTADLGDDTYGLLIWEAVYNGINPANTDTWELSDMINDNFWIYVQASPDGTGTIQNFNSNLNDWLNSNPVGQASDPVISLGVNTYILGLNVGVGSGWGNSFSGYLDALRIAFGATDDVLYNFEQCQILMANQNIDVLFESSFECFQTR
jgi:hypothetical protein